MFGSSNTFDPSKDIPDLSGKVYVVTGGSAGIGFGICAHILEHNPEKLYLLSNKEDHAKDAQQELAKWGDSNRVEWLQCNLASLKQTDDVAGKLATLPRIDALVLNAGLGVGKYWETEDGLDSHMQVNYIAQFHLAMTLLPVLQKTPDSRLVLQASDLHRAAPDVSFTSVSELNQDIGPMKLYNRSKLAQVLFIKALARRQAHGELGFTPGQGPWMNATHPGGVQTDQQKQAEEAYGTLGKIGVAAVKPFMKDPVAEGCRPALFASTSHDIVTEKITGQYIVPDRKVTEVSKQGNDEILQENLWRLSFKILEDRLGEKPRVE